MVWVAFEYFLLGCALKQQYSDIHKCIYQPFGVMNIEKNKCQLRSWEAQLKPEVYVNSLYPEDLYMPWKQSKTKQNRKTLFPWKPLFTWETCSPKTTKSWQISYIQRWIRIECCCCQPGATLQGRCQESGKTAIWWKIALLPNASYNLAIILTTCL